MQIDTNDRKLLALLRENARRPVSDLARRLDLPRTTVQTRLDRLEQSGVIAGYTLRTAPIDGPPLRATVLLSRAPRSGPAVLAALRGLPGIEMVHTTSGRFDLMIQIAARTTAELEDRLDRIGAIDGVESLESLIHLSTRIDHAP
ncbi:Lrp/AsnC family transcriptional regulator [Pseudodonghicola flavimaris]|uniref:Lrp/AsnC family transcriptional regulator n=1 Tax=Pseudodonghicola flavimaris TaxID=3050036 RepID=A0ABT7F5W8_9RHOB|nr:Lrp/AsnC family transcriptional regulator [Pseudodonghicola flavimaris]MDK3020002.1 Lrp/AsnC family transcriptional regulator [Pseudodonghicola flavimaris]